MSNVYIGFICFKTLMLIGAITCFIAVFSIGILGVDILADHLEIFKICGTAMLALYCVATIFFHSNFHHNWSNDVYGISDSKINKTQKELKDCTFGLSLFLIIIAMLLLMFGQWVLLPSVGDDVPATGAGVLLGIGILLLVGKTALGIYSSYKWERVNSFYRPSAYATLVGLKNSMVILSVVFFFIFFCTALTALPLPGLNQLNH